MKTSWIDWLMDNTHTCKKANGILVEELQHLPIVADNTTEINYEKFTVKIAIADEWADVSDNYVTETFEITTTIHPKTVEQQFTQ